MNNKTMSILSENIDNTLKKEEKKINSFSEFMHPEIKEAYEEVLSGDIISIF